uniref:Uncharacterized protein n=1 Tax=Acrobeloides nanus TaxID=290746 RepID=A0A914DFX2_9BILA
MITIPQLKDDQWEDVEFETPDQFVEHNREELGVPAFLRINECRKDDGRIASIERILHWIFPTNLSQDSLLKRERVNKSRACALICVKLAEYLIQFGIMLPEILFNKKGKNTEEKIFNIMGYPLPPRFLNAYVKAIVDGNEVYDKRPTESGFGVEEALTLMGSGMVLVERSKRAYAGKLHGYMRKAIDVIHKDVSRLKQIFFLLGSVSHCILVIYQPWNKTIAYVDSSGHHDDGGTFVMCRESQLVYFCHAMILRMHMQRDSFFLYWIARKEKDSILPTPLLFSPAKNSSRQYVTN